MLVPHTLDSAAGVKTVEGSKKGLRTQGHCLAFAPLSLEKVQAFFEDVNTSCELDDVLRYNDWTARHCTKQKSLPRYNGPKA